MLEIFMEFPPEVGVDHIDAFSRGFLNNSKKAFDIQHKMLDMQGVKYERAFAEAVREEKVLKIKVSPPIPTDVSRRVIEEGWLEVFKQHINEVESVGGKGTIRVVE